MPNASRLKRYLLILEKVRRQPSFAALQEHLADHGFELSDRTLQRDIERLRVDLGIEVEYDRPNNVYRLAEGEENDAVLKLIERAQLLELVGDDPRQVRELAQVVDLDGLGALQGLHHMPLLVRSIRERKEAVLTYKRFQTDRECEHRIQPVLLKEYMGRWYVLGWTLKYKGPTTFGLDRIGSVIVTEKRFGSGKLDRVRTQLASMIGVDASPGVAERVVVEVDHEQARYLETLPWHRSQQLEGSTGRGVRFSWFVRPNYELRQRLLSYGDRLVVVEPKWLAKEIRDLHKNAASRYRK